MTRTTAAPATQYLKCADQLSPSPDVTYVGGLPGMGGRYGEGERTGRGDVGSFMGALGDALSGVAVLFITDYSVS